MKKKYRINDKDFEIILGLNKEGSDTVMYLSGGLPLGSGPGGNFRGLQGKINDFWKVLGKQEGFDDETIEPINDREFYAEEINKDVE